MDASDEAKCDERNNERSKNSVEVGTNMSTAREAQGDRKNVSAERRKEVSIRRMEREVKHGRGERMSQVQNGVEEPGVEE